MLEENKQKHPATGFYHHHVQTTNVPSVTQTNLIAIEADWSIH